MSRKFPCSLQSLAVVFSGGIMLFSPMFSWAEDHLLVIAGGSRAASNQISLEKNVRFFREVRDDVTPLSGLSVYFANGNREIPSVQFEAPDAKVPKANDYMARLFGSTSYLKLSYRPHELGRVQGDTSLENLTRWFDTKGKKMKSGDRLFLYVTAHGGKSREKPRPENTTIYLWNQQVIDVKGLQKQMTKLPEGVSVILIMAQCYAGGFAHAVFEGTDPETGVLDRPLCGFFATVSSRPAAGCTPEINEENYDEFSSHFWAAIRGTDRLGKEVEDADYNGDGAVSLEEAHGYTILVSRNIDIPIKTSGAFLRERSRFAGELPNGKKVEKKQGDAEQEKEKGENKGASLLERRVPYSEVLELASATDQRILEGLCEHLELSGEDRYSQSETKAGEIQKKRGELQRQLNEQKKVFDGHRNAIRNELYGRWPGLANLLTEESVRLLREDAPAFVEEVEEHPRFSSWNEVGDERKRLSQERFDLELQWVQLIRFQRAHNNVVLAENLQRLDSKDDRERFRIIREGESRGLSSSLATKISGAE